MTDLSRDEARYAPYYCEENVWHLCRDERLARREQRVLFVSNETRTVAMWAQLASRRHDGLVLWDYHVVLVTEDGEGADWLVWDLDTRLGFPAALSQWLAGTFQLLPPSLSALGPRFRLMEGSDYVERFASDRSHMLDPQGGWLNGPPEWPPIGVPDQASVAGAKEPPFLRWTQMVAGDDSLSMAALVARFGL